MPEYANAFPRKRFFLDMFTRDISVEDCILDLIDNSIDALIRTRHIALSSLLRSDGSRATPRQLPKIQFSYSPRAIELVDNCGGIPHGLVRDDVFSFGHTRGYKPTALGVYGVGLKRALFKLGGHFEMESRAMDGGFRVELDVDNWAKSDDKPEDWQIPVTRIPAASTMEKAGTKVRVTRLRSDVRQRLSDPTTESRLDRNVRQAYTLFLERYVRLLVQTREIKPEPLPLTESSEVTPGSEHFVDDDTGVKVTLMVSLAPLDRGSQWASERAGWFVFCNGRLVVAADKSDLTGWGTVPTGLPIWHPKYRGFFGVVFFESGDPLALPWTTTKRGLNRESPIYQRTMPKMVQLAKPVVRFLNKMYPTDSTDVVDERAIARDISPVGVSNVAHRRPSPFAVTKRAARGSKSTVSVQYQATTEEIERVKKRLGKPTWGANRVGRHVLEHYLDKECPQ